MEGKVSLGILLAALFFSRLFLLRYPLSRISPDASPTDRNTSDTLKDFGQANQSQQVELCGGPFGANSTYCDTVLK
jgi:hypothetical protein